MWTELGLCLRDLANSEALLGLYVFVDLPRRSFRFLFFRELLDEARTCLSDPKSHSSHKVAAAFNAQMMICLQLKHDSVLIDMAGPLLPCILQATSTILAEGLIIDLQE
ncbi:unnamed protein product [Microthlaspi erraticum]|uniref:DUF577 domain-containing protein n=1 Tax=Microthlaspi erraticum TaxID=1685480 RepID=A0A6D2JBU0_9BRAS|nr:unnamed protein product [Microthlaspi erraticum]